MRTSIRISAAVIAAVAVAEIGVQLLRPRSVGPKAASLDTTKYFTDKQIDRAKDYQTRQLILYGASTAIEIGLLVFLVKRPPRRLVGKIKRPVLAGAVVGAALSLTIASATIPVKLIARERAKDVGLVTQSLPGWIVDFVKSQGIGALFAGAGGAVLVFGMRRFGSRWWIPGTAVVLAFGVITTYIGPVILDPIFNRFKVLPPGSTRTEVLDLAKRANVKVGEVYEVDASRRTTAANAYVTGFGNTKRVVLYDNLLKDFTPEEIQLVVAHELSHVRNNDVPNGLLYFALIAPFGLLAVALISQRLTKISRNGSGQISTALAIPAVALSITVIAPILGTISNQLSRDIERRADYFALKLTENPTAMIDFEKRIAVKNVINPNPSPIISFLFSTHPTTMERIGSAVAFEKQSPNF